MVKAVVGANWGDEGKGKITDMLAKEADIIIRFQGGANAGHTIVNDYGKFALHTLPSGVFYGHTTSIIGNGVALNIPVLFNEMKSITDRDVPKPKLLVSDRCQMVMPYHILFDQYEEERLGGKSFGSTKSGIAPFYSDKYAKYGAIGAGIPPYEIKQIVTVCKAYSSAVGGGAFVSEIFGDEADELRRRGGDGGEFGATTGRPRRMGWFDCVASKYGCRMQGTTDVAFTVLDVLGYLDEIPVCVGYEINGEVTTEFPVTHDLEKAKPVLKVLPGWKNQREDIRGIKKFEDLPENCRKYVEFIEEQIGYPITMVSNGPGRNDIIYRESPLKK